MTDTPSSSGQTLEKPETAAVLITGAGQRIGRHLALFLGGLGYSVAVHYNRSDQSALEVVQAIRDQGGTATAVGADLMDRDAVATLVARAAAGLGTPILRLVNNASLFLDDRITDFSPDLWDRHMGVNALAPLMLIQALAAQRPKDVQACAVNIIDQRVWRLNPTFTTYTASKSVLWTLTQTSAQGLAPFVRVNAIGPGPVLRSIHQSDNSFGAEAANVPLGHGPQLDEIARTTHMLFTTPSVTGQMIALDGGQHLAWQTPDLDDQ